MTAFDLLKKLCDKQGISINTLEEKIGLSKNTLYSWKKNTPKGSNLVKVADYFNVSTDYLLGRTNQNTLDDIHTIAAHHDGDDWTEDELEEIERFKEFVKLKRKQKGE